VLLIAGPKIAGSSEIIENRLNTIKNALKDAFAYPLTISEPRSLSGTYVIPRANRESMLGASEPGLWNGNWDVMEADISASGPLRPDSALGDGDGPNGLPPEAPRRLGGAGALLRRLPGRPLGRGALVTGDEAVDWLARRLQKRAPGTP
tara:strand:- start:356 stop:802 length:447 start_codon:yes stop_codon:yes gene_type:complete